MFTWVVHVSQCCHKVKQSSHCSNFLHLWIMLQNIIRVNTRRLGPAEPMDKFHLKMLQLSDPNFYISLSCTCLTVLSQCKAIITLQQFPSFMNYASEHHSCKHQTTGTRRTYGQISPENVTAFGSKFLYLVVVEKNFWKLLSLQLIIGNCFIGSHI